MPKPRALDIFSPVGGLVTDAPSTLLDKRAMPSCDNVFIENGVVSSGPGIIDSNLVSGAFAGNPLKVVRFKTIAGNYHTLLMTLSNIYNISSGIWNVLTVATWAGNARADRVSHCLINDAIVFTNGADNVHYWTGTGDPAELDDGGTKQKADCVASLGVFTLQGGPTISATHHPHRIFWSAAGVYTGASSWTVGTNLCGFEDTYGAPGVIIEMEPIGPLLAVYKTKSIVLGRYVGGQRVFAFAEAANIGCLAANSVQPISNTAHIFLGEDNVYLYTAGAAPMPIGDPIRDDLFNRLDTDNADLSFAYVHPAKSLYTIWINTQDGTKTKYSYNYKSNTWTRGTHEIEMFAGGLAYETSGLTIDTWFVAGGAPDSTTIDTMYATDPTMTIDGIAQDEGDEVYLLVSNGTLDYTYEESYGSVTAGTGLNSTCVYETPDFAPTGDYIAKFARWMLFEFESTGSGTVTITYSTDGGVNFSSLGTQSLTPTGSDTQVRSRLFFQLVSRKVRFKFSGDSFAIRWVAPSFLPAARY